MSSSNRVGLSCIDEAEYGVTPSGVFTAIKFTGESLTGTPNTAESAEIRNDRQTSGQVNTGLELSGGFEFEASADSSLEFYIRQAMMSEHSSVLIYGGSITIDAVAGTITTNGDFLADGIADEDMLTLTGFANIENNTVIVVSNVLAGSLDFIGEGLVDEGPVSATLIRPPYHEIGVADMSSSISKEFFDLDDGNVRSISYAGMRVGEFKMDLAFGEIIKGSFALAGNGYDQPLNPITNGNVVTPVGSDPALDASNGFGLILIDGVEADICLETLSFSVNNNLKPQNCIGALAPKNQVPGSSGVKFETKAHLGINSWDLFMPAKISQVPVSLAFWATDFNGDGYGVVMNRVQVNFPDPMAGSKDETITIDISGTASYESGANTTMRIYLIGVFA